MSKRNKIILIISCIFLVIAGILLILGFYLSGADIIGWLSSKWAMWIYIILGLYLGTLLFIFIGDKIKRL